MKNINWTWPIILVLGYIILKKVLGDFGDIFHGIGEGLGIADTKDEQADVKDTREWEKIIENLPPAKNPFHVNYGKPFKVGSKIMGLTVASKNNAAKQIYDSIGTFTDSPQQTMGGIKIAKYKSQVSDLAAAFYAKYKLDLFSFLQNKLDNTEQRIIFGKIINYVNGLPTGIELP